MPARGPRLHQPARHRTVLVGATVALAALAGLSGCSLSSGASEAGQAQGPTSTASRAPSTPGASAKPSPSVRLTTNVPQGAKTVAVDTVLTARAAGGRVSAVSVASKAGTVPGTISADGATWRAGGLLEPGSTYTMKVSGVGTDGLARTTTTRFKTTPLSLAQQTFPSVYPLSGQTVGVGMPVIVKFDVAVTDRASFEKHMHVVTQPAQQGSWYWLSDHEAHWRPKTYWQPGTKVSVRLDLNSVPAGHGVFGQVSRAVDFTIGASHIYRVNTRTDQMKVFSNGRLLRTIPVTTGKPGFTTRSGVKVIIEKFPVEHMNSETVGIGKNNPNYYDISDVRWAMRMTYSGEFLHAAPWSVYAQGHENVSHGCTGMSTADAGWLYHMTLPGDVVIETGTNRPMEFTNGYGDWNMSWADYRAGSALTTGSAPKS